MVSLNPSTFLKRAFLPFLSWVGELKNTDTLKADLMAGLTVALVLIPQSMAYAQLAGLPAYYGLYASFLPPMIAAIFGSSRQLATGPVAVVSLLTATSLEPLATANPEGFVIYAAMLSLMVGVFQLFLGLTKSGVLVDLLSHPVVIGFTNAGAIIIATSQLSKIFGVEIAKTDHHYDLVINVVQAAFNNTHLLTLMFAVIAFVIMITSKRFLPRIPGVLLAVVITTAISYFMKFHELGGKVVGSIPAGLPSISIPEIDFSVMLQLFTAAITISLIGFMEAISIAKAMAAKTRQRLNTNQELIGQGLSNITASLFGTYPVSGSFSRSAVNIDNGAKTGFSSIVTGLVVGISLLWLTPLLWHLPQATLAAVIIMAVVNLVKIEPIIHAWHAERQDGIVAIATFIFTLLYAPHLDKGILIGVGLTISMFIIRSMRPRMAVLSRFKDATMRDISVHKELDTCEYISMVRFDYSLLFANASYFETKVLEISAKNPKLRFIIFDAEGVNTMDATGESMLRNLAERLQQNGIEFIIARMKKQFVGVMKRTGLIEIIPEERIFSRITFALEYAWDVLDEDTDHDMEKCPLARPKEVQRPKKRVRKKPVIKKDEESKATTKNPAVESKKENTTVTLKKDNKK
ncbi:MAG: sodium-independent anion transporter [Gammaproteobacteria bacterium]|nr:MAG: sodium-independent anion transporter [Gammaproteobacteria bacterium]